MTEIKSTGKKFKWIIVFSNTSEVDFQRLRENMILELNKRFERGKKITVDSDIAIDIALLWYTLKINIQKLTSY